MDGQGKSTFSYKLINKDLGYIYIKKKAPLFRKIFLININISAFLHVLPRFLKPWAVIQHSIRYAPRSTILHIGKKLARES